MLRGFSCCMNESRARKRPIKSAQVGFLIVHPIKSSCTGPVEHVYSRAGQHIRRVRTDGVKAASLTVAKEASVFSPQEAGSCSHSCQLLSVNLLFSAHPAPLQPITGAAVFRYCSQSCFDVMVSTVCNKGIISPKGPKHAQLQLP